MPLVRARMVECEGGKEDGCGHETSPGAKEGENDEEKRVKIGVLLMLQQ